MLTRIFRNNGVFARTCTLTCICLGMMHFAEAQVTTPPDSGTNQGRVLATPFGARPMPQSSAIVQRSGNAPSIPFGGTLPKEDEAVSETGPSAEAPELLLPPQQFEPDQTTAPSDDVLDSRAPIKTDAESLQAMQESTVALIKAIESVHDDVRDKSSWLRQAQRVKDGLQAIADHQASQSPSSDWSDLVADLSLEARSLNQAISTRLSQGLSSEHFPAVHEVRDQLANEIIRPLIPWERQAGLPTAGSGIPSAQAARPNASLDPYRSLRPGYEAYPALPPVQAIPPRTALEFSWESRGYPDHYSYRFGWEEPPLAVPVPAYAVPSFPFPVYGYGPYGAVVPPFPFGYPPRGAIHLEIPFGPAIGFGW